MAERTHDRERADERNTDSGPDASSGSQAAGDDRDSDLAARVADLERERDELSAHWSRAQADYQNLRRRLQSDIDAAVIRAKKPLVQDLLLVLDYLEMALATRCTSTDAKDLLAGVELTRTALVGTLDRENVRAIPEGGSFDASLHDAVERVETRERASGEIVATLRRGYTMNGQVLRPAQVKVAVDPGLREAGPSTRDT